MYSLLVYSGSDSETLVPAQANKNLLTVPIGSGFRISISRNEKKLSDYSTRNGFKSVRATRKAFSAILKAGKELGFKLCDLTLNKGESEIVTVRNDPVIAEETYGMYTGDNHIFPTYLGFTNGLSTVTFDIGMKIGCTEYIRESGYLIFDAVSGILDDLSIYQDIQNSFQPKRSDDEVSVINPVSIECKFENTTQLVNYLDSFFSGELEISASEGRSAEFSSPEGTWGEMVVTDNGVDIYYRSKVDFSLGIRLLDALKSVVMK